MRYNQRQQFRRDAFLHEWNNILGDACFEVIDVVLKFLGGGVEICGNFYSVNQQLDFLRIEVIF